MKRATKNKPEPDHVVAVIGAGPGGICAGVKLRKAGIEDFVILERSDEVGGSWRDNTYPGIGVDVPGLAYQYSFARNPNWSRFFPKGAEVMAYHQSVVQRYDLLRHCRFGVEVVREVWDDQRQWWTLHTAAGDTVTARFLISAVGAFIAPKTDGGLAGLDDFEGKLLRPTEWDHDYDLDGKRVAIIGTGASSVQITPSIAAQVGQLAVFQRTPVWCLPKPDFEVAGWLQRVLGLPGVGPTINAPLLIAVDAFMRTVCAIPPAVFDSGAKGMDAGAKALYRSYLRLKVDDADDRDMLAPDYGILGKRPTFSNAYLSAFNRDNVSLITTAIDRITARGIRTVDGVEHPLDALVLAVGYQLFSDPESYPEGKIVGRNGFDLGKFFADNRLQAYESGAIPGLPNRWMVVGPYSWTGTGWHELVEISSTHGVNLIAEALRRGHQTFEVSQRAHASYHDKIVRQGRNVQAYFNIVNKGLRTYYVNSQGDMPYIRPTSLFQARRAARHVPLDDYEFASATPAPSRKSRTTSQRTIDA